MSKILILLLYLFFITFCAYPAWNDYNVRAINNIEGLPDKHVNQILQDSDGFMWFATNNQTGLCLVDKALLVEGLHLVGHGAGGVLQAGRRVGKELEVHLQVVSFHVICPFCYSSILGSPTRGAPRGADEVRPTR